MRLLLHKSDRCVDWWQKLWRLWWWL